MHLLTMRNLALNPKRAFPFDQITSKFNLLVAYWLKGTPMDRPTLFSQIIVKIEVCITLKILYQTSRASRS